MKLDERWHLKEEYPRKDSQTPVYISGLHSVSLTGTVENASVSEQLATVFLHISFSSSSFIPLEKPLCHWDAVDHALADRLKASCRRPLIASNTHWDVGKARERKQTTAEGCSPLFWLIIIHLSKPFGLWTRVSLADPKSSTRRLRQKKPNPGWCSQSSLPDQIRGSTPRLTMRWTNLTCWSVGSYQ